jgi:poly-gamma-glutamate capsule biosynthesis protein CapA/YwtB (metallophosphatase superfamily)
MIEQRSAPATLFLCGDVMTGRGIDQILPSPGNWTLHEPYVKDARRYVELAEETSGAIPRGADFAYIWGDALWEWERRKPDLRIINLETSVTKSDDYWRGKSIHYRMNPQNVGCLTAARIDCCALANNHLLDWGYAGLAETLETLHPAGVKTAGAGMNSSEAAAPAVLDLGLGRRVLVFSLGAASSGIPESWAATRDGPGVNILDEDSELAVERIRQSIASLKSGGDMVIVSIHWGDNWGYEVPHEQRKLAHRLISEAQVDIIHGHSSHHVKGIEVYRERLILYGCGDLLTDYEGISGREMFRGDLGLLYFAVIDPATGKLLRLEMTPVQVRRMQLRRAAPADVAWLKAVLNREGAALGTRVEPSPSADALTLHWG